MSTKKSLRFSPFAVLCVMLLICNSAYPQKFLTSTNRYDRIAVKEMIDAAKKGDAESQYLVGKYYLNGMFIQKDEDKGMEYLIKSRDNGYSVAWKWFADNTESLEERTTYLKKAFECYRDKDKEHLDINEIMYELYKMADNYLKDNIDAKALPILYYVDEQGWSQATDLLAQYFCDKKDFSKALKYARKAVQLETMHGYWILAEMNYYGHGVSKDITKAVDLYAKAAEKGEIESQERLAELYYEGKDIPRDYNMAFFYSKQVVENEDRSPDSGTGDIMHQIAACYRFGRGTKQNTRLAYVWEIIASCFSANVSHDIMELVEHVNPDDPSQMVSLLYKKVIPYADNKSVEGITLQALYALNVSGDYNNGLSLMLSAYNHQDITNFSKCIVGNTILDLCKQNKNVAIDTSEIQQFIDEYEKPTEDDFDKWFWDVIIGLVIKTT